MAAIDRQAEVLKSNALPGKRLNALKYLVHLVGDVHQPLHAGYLDDKGGNTCQLQAFMRGSNLHAFWDSGLIKNLDEEVEAMTTRLSKRQVAKPLISWTPQSAAEASCSIVGAEGFYPARKVDVAYVTLYVPILEQRLVKAGSSLAWVLNSSLK